MFEVGVDPKMFDEVVDGAFWRFVEPKGVFGWVVVGDGIPGILKPVDGCEAIGFLIESPKLPNTPEGVG